MRRGELIQPQPRPWGRAAALLAACVVTLIGLIRGLSPEVILLRGVCAAVLIGLIVRVAVRMGVWLVSSSG